MSEELRLILNRINKVDIKIFLSRWGKFPVDEINYCTTKHGIIQQVLQLMKEINLKSEDVYQLDLLYLADHSNKKLWQAYRMVVSRNVSLDQSSFESSNFQKCLMQQLSGSHACSVQVRKHNYALWGRVKQRNSNHVLYFIYFPHSPFFLLSKATITLTKIVTRVLKSTLGYKEVEAMTLESNSPDSLAQILLHNLTPEVDYIHDEGYFKPNERFDKEALRSFCDDRVRIQHIEQLKKQKMIVDKQYGPMVQPQLPFLTITTSTRFRGSSTDIPPSTVIKCRTKIIGNNVLEGLRKAALNDLCLLPLPRFLTDAAQNGQQCIKVTDVQNS